MSDSEQRQLHVPYREYHSHHNTNSTALVETDALVDLSVTPQNPVPASNDTSEVVPDVEFVTNPSTDQPIAIDSPGIDRESQPLLGRLELDVTFNRFPGSSFHSADVLRLQWRPVRHTRNGWSLYWFTLQMIHNSLNWCGKQNAR